MLLVFNLDLSAPPSLSQSVHFLLPGSSGASLPREPVCLILAGCAKTGSEGPARRCFSLWRNSPKGCGLPRGRALRLPVLHNLVPNVPFICLFKYQHCTNDWLSLPFLAIVFPSFPSHAALNGSCDWLSLCHPCSTHLMSAESIINDLRGLAVTGSLHQLLWGGSHNAPGPGAAAGSGSEPRGGKTCPLFH